MRVADDLSIQQFVEKPKDPAVIASLALSPTLEAKLHEHVRREALPRLDGHLRLQPRGPRRGPRELDDRLRQGGDPEPPRARRSSSPTSSRATGRTSARCSAFFEANLALAQPLPPFNFFDATTPVYTHYEYLPASKLNKCAIDNVVVADGCILTDSKLKHSLLGIRSYVGEGSDLEDVVVMGADYYETPEQIASNVAARQAEPGRGQGLPDPAGHHRQEHPHRRRLPPAVGGQARRHYANGAVVIRDGVLVVPKGAVIPPGTVV